MKKSAHIGFLLFPDLLQMDLTGPYGVLAAGPDVKIDLFWKDLAPVISSDGLQLTPTVTTDACPPLDVLCVPGGRGIHDLLRDDHILQFLQLQARHARYVASICTGSLVLGAAGLLHGVRATTHWLSWDLLTEFGAVATKGRIVVDGNRITAAGVSAGIDMAFLLAAELWGETIAQEIQLGMEYAPEPPFAAGEPQSAPAAIVQSFQQKNSILMQTRRREVQAAAAKLRARKHSS